MTPIDGEEHVPERKTVLGESMLVRGGLVIGICVLVVGVVGSYFGLKQEIRDQSDVSALSLQSLRTDVQALRYDLQTRTDGVVSEQALIRWIETMSRANRTNDTVIPPFGG